MSTVAELQQLLAAEAAAHTERLARLRKEASVLETAMADQTENFHELITRVTNLRVARGEYTAALAQGLVKDEKFQTGSEAVDRVLYHIQDALRGAEAAGSAGLMQQLEVAAQAAVTGYAPGRPAVLNAQNSSAIRTTGVVVMTRNDVRGVQAWARRQAREMPQFADALRRGTPAWETGRPYAEPPNVGMAAAPALHAVPGKTFHKATLSIVRDRSMAERSEEMTFDAVRVVVTLGLCGRDGAPIANPAQVATQLTQVAAKWAERSLREVQEAMRKSAPFYVEATRNDEVAAAMEMLLHGLRPKVVCQPAQQPLATLHKGLTAFHLHVSITAMTQVSATEPFANLLHKQQHRQYLLEHLVKPLLARVGGLVGCGEDFAHYTSVAVSAADGLFRLAERNGIVSSGSGSGSGAKAAGTAATTGVTDRLYTVLHALSAFGTRLDVDLALAPRTEIKTAADAKANGIRLARSFLRNFCAPEPLVVPMAVDPESTDVVVRLYNAPTVFLEILNRMFTSNERLPASSRKSLLDVVVSPRSKLSLALRLYSELCVEVFRPYSRQSGVVIAAENGAGGRPKAPPQVPVTELPVDIVAANLAVAKAAADGMRKLAQLEKSVGEPSELEEKGRTVLHTVMASVGSDASVADFKKEILALNLEVRQTLSANVDCLLPFGTSVHDAKEARRPLLYLRANGM